MVLLFCTCTIKENEQLTEQREAELFLDKEIVFDDSVYREDKERLTNRLLLLGNGYYNNKPRSIDSAQTNKQKKELTHQYIQALKTKDSVLLARIYFDLAEYFQYHGGSDSSYYYYNKSSEYYKRLKDVDNLQKTYLYSGILLSSKGVFIEAQLQLLQGIALNTLRVNQHSLYSQAFVLAVIKLGLDRNDDAILLLKRAEGFLVREEIESYYSSNQLLMNKISIKNNLSRAYIRNGEYLLAEQTLQEASELLSQLEPKDKESFYSMLLYTHATLYLKSENYEQAFSFITEAMLHSLKIRDYYTYNLNKALLGEYKVVTGILEEGIDLLEEVLIANEKYNDLKIKKRVLELLVQYDKTNAKRNFFEYKQVVDLISNEVNSNRSRFARLEHKADYLIQSNEELKSKNNFIAYISISIVFCFIGIICFVFYRYKAKEVALIQLYQRDTLKYYDSIIDIQNSITEAQELERKKFAKELHDGVLNKLFVTRFSLLQLEDDNLEVAKGSLVNELQEVETFIRNSSHTLYNDEKFLANNFKQLLEELVVLQNRSINTLFTCEIDSRIEMENLSTYQKVNIYRVLQEAFQNIHKYAHALEGKLILTYLSKESFQVEVLDNGKGFNIKSVKRGLGIKNMEDRLESLNSSLILRSKKGIGTSVLFEIRYH